MDQYVSWCLSVEELNLDTIWGKFEEFCKSQSNEVRAHFDLLTSFRQGNKSVDEWYNVVQTQFNWSKYSPETAKILHRDIFWFYQPNEEFVSKTINVGNVDLDKFLQAKLGTLPKEWKAKRELLPYKTSVWGPTSCINQPSKAPVYRADSRKIQEKEVLCYVLAAHHIVISCVLEHN